MLPFTLELLHIFCASWIIIQMKYFVNTYRIIFFLDAVAGRQEPNEIRIAGRELVIICRILHADIFLVFLFTHSIAGAIFENEINLACLLYAYTDTL